MFEHSAYQPPVQTASSGPCKCKCMKKNMCDPYKLTYDTSFQVHQTHTLVEKEEHDRGQGAQWLSGRVLDSRPKGRGFEPHRRHCVVVLEQDTFILA